MTPDHHLYPPEYQDSSTGLMAKQVNICINQITVRDGPFVIGGRGGGLASFLTTNYFFSFFSQQVIFFKSKLQQVCYFLKK